MTDSFPERFEPPRALSPEADSSLLGGRRDEANGRMIEANGLHPSPERLSDFALGKLDDDQIAAIANHLSDCPTCLNTAATATDSFVDLLRPDRIEPLDSSALPASLRHHCRYRIIRRLGRGGMGTVYLAEHCLMKQQRAIKVINPALIGNDRAVERFVREIELLPRLHHPNIVQAHDAEKTDGLYLLVMEYVEGETLAELVERHGPLPLGTACAYAQQVALGLQYAHEQGLVHRDIKPANLMRTSAGQIKILDFGLARLARESGSAPGLTHEHATMGTPDYLAPEQVLDAHHAGSAADIYSLGCTLFYLLTGKPPFEKPSALAVSAAHLHEPPPSLRELRPDVPDALCDLVQRMLSKLPNQRPQTPGEVARRLAQLVEEAATGSGRNPGITTAEHAPFAQKPARSPGWARCYSNRVTRWGSALLLLMVAVTLICWASGVLRGRTPNGTIVMEQVPDNAEVLVDGKRVTVKLPGQKGPIEVRVSPGRRQLEIRIANVSIFSREVEVDAGGRVPMTVRLEPLAPAPAPAKKREPADSDGFVSLFNGKDRAGWKTHPVERDGWSIESGVLSGRGPQATTLFTEGDDYTNFRAYLEVRTLGPGICGLGIRYAFSPFSLSTPAPVGYLAQLETQRDGSVLTSLGFHSNMGGHTLPQPTGVRTGQWCRMEVIAEGNRIRILVNDVARVDETDPVRRFSRGHLAPFVHFGAGFEIRKITIKKLSLPE